MTECDNCGEPLLKSQTFTIRVGEEERDYCNDCAVDFIQKNFDLSKLEEFMEED